MIKLLFDFIQFLNTLAPLLMALAVLTLLSVLLSKSIKKHAAIYYTVFAIPFAIVVIPLIGRWFGVEIVNLGRLIPFMGNLTRDYIHAGTLGFPLLVIIMYMGALDMKLPWVKKLMSIRKELSILSGFPILTHALMRIGRVPNAFLFFTDNEAYMASGRVTSALGAGLSSFSFVLGAVMLALFIPLWATSFDFVRKRMGSVRWKKLQRWSYALYAMLFIHAMGIQAGGMLNPRGGREQSKPAVEAVATIAYAPGIRDAESQGLQQRTGRGERGGNRVQPSDSSRRSGAARPEGRGERRGERGNRNAVQPADSSKHTGSEKPAERSRHSERSKRNAVQPVDGGDDHTEAGGQAGSSNRAETEKPAEHEHGGRNAVQPAGSGNNAEAARPAAGGGRQQSPGFADIKVSSQTKRYIHITSLFLIFGSYLYLRLRKRLMISD